MNEYSKINTDKIFICEELKKLERWPNLRNIAHFVDEVEKNSIIKNDIERAVSNVDFFRTKSWNSILDLGIYRVFLYALCRAIKPKVFVETGVLHGLGSIFILAALKLNKIGTLVSIDEPSYFEVGPSNQDGIFDTLPPGKEPGWIINDRYKDSWKLVIGKSNNMLPKICAEHDNIDIFLHDSEHTKSNMTFELECAWPNIRKGGFLICDNIKNNTSFFDFCVKAKRTPTVFPAGGPSYIIPNKNERDEIKFGIIMK